MEINLIQHSIEGEILAIFTGPLELFLPFPDTSEQDSTSRLKLAIEILDSSSFPDGVKGMRYNALMKEHESGKQVRLETQLSLVSQPLQRGAENQFVFDGEVPNQNEWYKFWVDRETKTVQHKTLIELRSKSTGNTLRPHAFNQNIARMIPLTVNDLQEEMPAMPWTTREHLFPSAGAYVVRINTARFYSDPVIVDIQHGIEL